MSLPPTLKKAKHLDRKKLAAHDGFIKRNAISIDENV